MLTDSFTIKKASPDAADTIAQFQIEMASESENISLDHETVMKGVQYIFQKPDLGFYLVAYDSRDKMAGCLLILKEWSDWRNADVWWLHSVFVVPDHRQEHVEPVRDVREFQVFLQVLCELSQPFNSQEVGRSGEDEKIASG